MHKFSLLIFTFLFATISAKAQTSISVELNTLSYQITDTQPDILKTKLSSDGKLAFEPAVVLGFDAYASSRSALHISQSFIWDKASHVAGATSVMIKFRLLKSYKHSLNIALGPVFHYRQSWADISGYENETIYNTASDWQYKFSWISGKMEYNYYLNKMNDLSISLMHIQPESVGLAIGFKHWINKKPRKKKRGCISCPSFH